ncbi:UDP-4-amino-4,6-dideoxy-N-acetyl-beta-L-altrosamine transaminase [Patulibacter sp.]|uniref:UDP-4-amino-4, 6-dideoxy-N-acetyl-beta-L-altrosamine transaminase n=1 Tax=Patulibacter sp. TaxID=1912859 RepID=UPI0027157961|nr:UDP-4-amino-4,6-dideoxy-N-acetyl-beta-L-altrosamine transaminase [Patulibacter sp.]MDO9408802.1 UDP-4-amino-4,6-dideoxy-N-acetyl-beta-L-altrosamine transaminase [Patulibacter sp.]
MTRGAPLPYARQDIDEADVAAVVEALRDPFITQGPRVESFERAVAARTGAKHCVAFSSGTAALHAAIFAADVGPGDEVISSPITFAASTNAALYQGATPRFVDIDPATWNLDTAAAAAAVNERTKAIVPVSFTGLPVDLAPLDGVRDRVVVIEDAAHALGAHRHGGPVGGPGGADITCFSLHPAKTITAGEGGLATTEDDELARRLRIFRTHGITKQDIHPSADEGAWYYEMQELGFNYRITDVMCALGESQLTRLDEFVDRRNALAARYRELLADEPRITLPPEAPEDSRHGRHLFVVHVEGGGAARRATFEGLQERGVGCQVHYVPVYRLPYYRDRLGVPQEDCPHAEAYYWGAISLPLFPLMTDDDVLRVVLDLKDSLPA